jgi:hypothetical protein
MARCIFLTGAPASEDLQWSGQHLENEFMIGQRQGYAATQLSSTWHLPKWRSIPFASNQPPPQTQFISFASFSAGAQIPDLELPPSQEDQQDFFSHSIALHDDQDGLETTFLTNNTFSFDSTATDYSDISVTGLPCTAVPSNMPITDLKAIPSAAHITALNPQTITVNLICGIISICPIRTITLKRRYNNEGSNEMDLFELLLGDDTRAGFATTFWLAPLESQNTASHSLREDIRELRTGDVVSFTNVALSVFRNCVYGRSLPGRAGLRSRTGAVKLERARGEGRGAVAVKCTKVYEWVDRFVGRVVTGGNAGLSLHSTGQQEGQMRLPPDTQ